MVYQRWYAANTKSNLTKEVQGLDVAVHDVLGVQIHHSSTTLLGHTQLDCGGQQPAQRVHTGRDAGQKHAGNAVGVTEPADRVVRAAGSVCECDKSEKVSIVIRDNLQLS